MAGTFLKIGSKREYRVTAFDEPLEVVVRAHFGYQPDIQDNEYLVEGSSGKFSASEHQLYPIGWVSPYGRQEKTMSEFKVGDEAIFHPKSGEWASGGEGTRVMVTREYEKGKYYSIQKCSGGNFVFSYSGSSQCSIPEVGAIADELSHAESEETRPWPVDSVWMLIEKDSKAMLVQIVAYLEEDDPVAETQVVYREVNGDDVFWSDTVERIQQHDWFRPFRTSTEAVVSA
jgi:hypothetical protein